MSLQHKSDKFHPGKEPQISRESGEVYFSGKLRTVFQPADKAPDTAKLTIHRYDPLRRSSDRYSLRTAFINLSERFGTYVSSNAVTVGVVRRDRRAIVAAEFRVDASDDLKFQVSDKLFSEETMIKIEGGKLNLKEGYIPIAHLLKKYWRDLGITGTVNESSMSFHQSGSPITAYTAITALRDAEIMSRISQEHNWSYKVYDKQNITAQETHSDKCLADMFPGDFGTFVPEAYTKIPGSLIKFEGFVTGQPLNDSGSFGFDVKSFLERMNCNLGQWGTTWRGRALETSQSIPSNLDGIEDAKVRLRFSFIDPVKRYTDGRLSLVTSAGKLIVPTRGPQQIHCVASPIIRVEVEACWVKGNPLFDSKNRQRGDDEYDRVAANQKKISDNLQGFLDSIARAMT
jgi:hypothetical protein